MSGNTIDVFAGKVPQRVVRSLGGLPYQVTYNFNAIDFGAGNSTAILATPANLRCKPLAVDVYNVSETFNSVTTSARVDIGDGSDADEFALTNDFADGTVGQVFTAFDGNLAVGDQEIIEPGDQVTVTFVAPTGGTPTGIANVGVTVLYFE